MIPTGIGIITVFFIFSEMVPGGPLDQVEAMIIDEANKAAEQGAALEDSSGATGGGIKIDPEVRMQIKRKLGLNHNRFERYMRMLLWFSPDSFISSKEISDESSSKVAFQNKNMIVYFKDGKFYVYDNKFLLKGEKANVMFDKEKKEFVCTTDHHVRFNPYTGKEIGGEIQLPIVPIVVKEETFDEFDFEPDGTKINVKEKRKEVYLKQSFAKSLFNWANWHGYFLLKFPVSITQNEKSYNVIIKRLPVSMRLGIVSFFLTYTLCIILGISKAVKNGTPFDSATSIVVLFGYGIPGFVLAVFLLTLFGPGSDALVHLFPLRGIQSPPEVYNNLSFIGKLWDNIHHLIAPVICLTIGSFAGLTMLTKNSVLEQFHQLYAVAARARGLSERKVLFKHVLRNSLIPLVTGFPARFVMMFFAGSLLIEKIFSLDGIGLLGYTALVQRDYPLMVSNLFVFTYIGLLCKLLADIGYVIVDPRISFEESKT